MEKADLKNYLFQPALAVIIIVHLAIEKLSVIE